MTNPRLFHNFSGNSASFIFKPKIKSQAGVGCGKDDEIMVLLKY